MKKIINVAFILSALTSFIFVLYLAVMPTAMNRDFFYEIYDNENYEIYQKNDFGGLSSKITMNKDDIKKALDHTLKFMLAEVEDLQIKVTFSNGDEENFYEASEISHMIDCQKLFVGGRTIAYSCLCILILCVGFLIVKRKEIESKNINYYFYGLLGIVALMAFIGIYAAIDFNTAFTKFHEIFFPQGNWSFSYTSYMIQMLPSDQVFQNIAYKMIIIFFILIAIVIAGMIVLKKFLQRKESLKSFTLN